jgi:hypothetical protein
MRTYKTNDPKVIAAARQYQADSEAVQQLGEAFAARYPNAKPLFYSDVAGRCFHGLKFTPALTDPLWTKPLPARGGIQTPRTAPAKGSKGVERRQQIEQLAELNNSYREHMPQFKADREALWEALGTDWGSVLFGGFQSFEQDGVFYFKTAIPEREGWVEILASEYDLALATHKAMLAASKTPAQQAAA